MKYSELRPGLLIRYVGADFQDNCLKHGRCYKVEKDSHEFFIKCTDDDPHYLYNDFILYPFVLLATKQGLSNA